MATSKILHPKSQEAGGTLIQSQDGHSKITMVRFGDQDLRESAMPSMEIITMRNWMQLESSMRYHKRLKQKLVLLTH